mmetsp:Transcript_68882/g.179460  ORF Transcript_68882/g.179460 Transcript_68882/m.179460 type:complete len:231 (+) Transcript_68882:501-1193(+)
MSPMLAGSSSDSMSPKPIVLTEDPRRATPPPAPVSTGTGLTHAGSPPCSNLSFRRAMSCPWEHLPSKSELHITSATTRKLLAPGTGTMERSGRSSTSPSHSAKLLGPSHGRRPPPKQCAEVRPKVGEMMEAPQPSQTSESGPRVGRAKNEYSAEAFRTTVPLMMRSTASARSLAAKAAAAAPWQHAEATPRAPRGCQRRQLLQRAPRLPGRDGRTGRARCAGPAAAGGGQ